MMMKMILVKFNTMQLMKKIISIMMLFAAAAMAFNSCQKQEVVAPEKANEVTLTFSSEKPSFVDESKTEWNGRSIVWSAGDKISVAYTVAGKWQNASGNASGDAKLYKSDELKSATDIAQFNVSANFKGTVAGTHVFYGVYPAPSETGFSNAPVASVTIPSTQTPETTSFDAAGDLMVGVSDEYQSLPGEKETISLKWHRLVAHAVITLKTLNGFTAGEILTGIKLTAQSGANLVGQQKVNLLTREVVKDNNAANVLSLTCGNLSISNDGTVSFWACVLPETITSLTVEVDTDKATYTREISGISKTFKQNARNTLAVNMSTATRVLKETESWKLVTPADGLTAGTYVLVASTSTKTGALVSTNGSSSAPTFDINISVEDNTLKGVSDFMQFDITGSANNWVLSVANDATKWLYCTDKNNGVRIDNNSNKTWTISAHDKDSDAFVLKHNGTSRYLGVYSNQDWRCYDALSKLDDVTGNTGTIYLYKKTSGSVAPDTTPKLGLDVESIELTAAGGEGSFTYTLSNPKDDKTVSATKNVDWIENLAVNQETKTVSYTVATNTAEDSREGTITLSYEGAQSVNVTVTQEGKASEIVKEETVIYQTAFNYPINGSAYNSSSEYVGTDAAGTSWGIKYGNWNSSNCAQLRVYSAGNFGSVYMKFDVANATRVTYKAKVSNTALKLNTYYSTDSGSTWTKVNSSKDLTTSLVSYEFTISDTGEYSKVRIKFEAAGTKPSSSNYQLTIDDVTIYGFLNGGETPEEPETPAEPIKLSAPVVKCSDSDITENSLKFTWDVVEHASKYVVTFDNGTPKETTNTYYEAIGLNANTQYMISVKAVGDEVNYTTSDAGTATGTTKEEQQSGGGDDSAVPVTISKTISSIAQANSWSNEKQYKTVNLDNVITAAVTGGGNTGKYYTNGNNWRLYQTESAKLTITAIDGYTINSVKITYTNSNNGTLKSGSSQIKTATQYNVNASSVTYSVGNTGSATNGQVRVTAIEVVYQKK